MVDAVTVLELLGGVALLFANGFFVTTEFAMTRVPQFDAAEFEESGSRGLQKAWRMVDRLEIYLSGCQLGITVASVGLGVVAEPAVAKLVAPVLGAVGLGASGGGHTALSVVLALGIINLLHVIVGEQAPTYLGVERTKQVARFGAPVLYWWTKLTMPFIYLADKAAKGLLGLFGVTITRSWADEEAEDEEGGVPTTRADLRTQMGTVLRGGDLSPERREEVFNALDIGETPVREVMVDHADVVSLSTSDSVEENLARVADHPHTRFPLVDGDLEDFRGVVYTPELARHFQGLQDGELDFADLAAPPMTIDADTPVSVVIDRFQDEHQELAMVVEAGGAPAGDEHGERAPDDGVEGRVVGLVTATDAFEAITGDLEDPVQR